VTGPAQYAVSSVARPCSLKKRDRSLNPSGGISSPLITACRIWRFWRASCGLLREAAIGNELGWLGLRVLRLTK
jgi:hypothetical protein